MRGSCIDFGKRRQSEEIMLSSCLTILRRAQPMCIRIGIFLENKISRGSKELHSHLRSF
jgi:hypothetical protein